jgi:hypothetical protein
MQYTQPYGNVNPNAGYVNGNPATGTPGSIIPAAAAEAAQREIVNCITQAGLAPDPANLTQLWQAILGFGGTLRPGQIVTLSSQLVMTSAMYRIGFNRTAALTQTTVLLPPNGTLPSSGQVQEFVIEDLAGNFGQFPITLIPSAGTIGGKAEAVLNKNGQSATVAYYGSNLWGIKAS